jgi:hypothetical protein
MGKGRFAAVFAARSTTPNEQKHALNSNDIGSTPPTPCSSIRDRQVLNRTPISLAESNNYHHHHHHHQQQQTLSSSKIPSSTTMPSNDRYEYIHCYFFSFQYSDGSSDR